MVRGVTSPVEAVSLDGAITSSSWAWVDSNYRPHAYQALSVVSTGVSGRQEWLNHAVSASAEPAGVTRTKAVCVTACVTAAMVQDSRTTPIVDRLVLEVPLVSLRPSQSDVRVNEHRPG